MNVTVSTRIQCYISNTFNPIRQCNVCPLYAHFPCLIYMNAHVHVHQILMYVHTCSCLLVYISTPFFIFSMNPNLYEKNIYIKTIFAGKKAVLRVCSVIWGFSAELITRSINAVFSHLVEQLAANTTLVSRGRILPSPPSAPSAPSAPTAPGHTDICKPWLRHTPNALWVQIILLFFWLASQASLDKALLIAKLETRFWTRIRKSSIQD